MPAPKGRVPGTLPWGFRGPQLLAPGASVSSRETPPSPPWAHLLDSAGFCSSLRLFQLLLQDPLSARRHPPKMGLWSPSSLFGTLPGASSSSLRHHWPWPCVNSVWAVVEPKPHLQGPLTFKSHLSFLSAHPPLPGAHSQAAPQALTCPALRRHSLCNPLPRPHSLCLAVSGKHTNRERDQWRSAK